MADIDMGTAVLVSLLAQIEITEESADYVWCAVAGLRQDPGIQ
ncbi:hypothetical protein V2J91_13750 [Pseudomonas alliivorans]|nr:hypothetical protein [Pseudomonas alliivorans]MEE5147146.1 hypothetical protein [Pseudomonas alliivorans]